MKPNPYTPTIACVNITIRHTSINRRVTVSTRGTIRKAVAKAEEITGIHSVLAKKLIEAWSVTWRPSSARRTGSGNCISLGRRSASIGYRQSTIPSKKSHPESEILLSTWALRDDAASFDALVSISRPFSRLV
jgi:hypothetical protein